MGRSQETYNKKEKEKKRLKKRQDKQAKKEERRANKKDGGLDNMIAYVDENGNISDTPPDPAKMKTVEAESIELGVPKREEEETPELKGRVQFYNDEKGFGFIKEQNSTDSHFFHVNGLIDEVQENDMVSFELEPGLKGMNAVRVKKI